LLFAPKLEVLERDLLPRFPAALTAEATRLMSKVAPLPPIEWAAPVPLWYRSALVLKGMPMNDPYRAAAYGVVLSGTSISTSRASAEALALGYSAAGWFVPHRSAARWSTWGGVPLRMVDGGWSAERA
jgi:hypothetical protein